MSQADKVLAALGLELPAPSTPGADYVPFVRAGDLVYVTGQLAQWNGERRFVGKLGREFGLEEGRAAARLAALNVIAHLRHALDGDLDRVAQFVRVTGLVNGEPDFTGASQVINGASELFLRVFGPAGRHTRMAYCVAALPYGVTVEVDAIVQVR